jgi:hypothetical protein
MNRHRGHKNFAVTVALTGLLVLPVMSEAVAASWVQFRPDDGWFWVDRDAVTRRGDLTYFKVVHSRESGVSPDRAGSYFGSDDPHQEQAYNCASGRHFAWKAGRNPGANDDYVWTEDTDVWNARARSMTLGTICGAAAAAIIQARQQNCYWPDVNAASPNWNVHYDWALTRGAPELKSNLGRKLGQLFDCVARNAGQLADTFADLSLVVARYVPNVSCFNGDYGVVSSDWSLHRRWAGQRNRDGMRQGTESKIVGAVDCLDRSKHSDYFADLSLIMGRAGHP